MEAETLYEEHFEYVWRSLRRLGLSEEATKDACQEVLLIAFRSLHRYDASRPIRPWLFGVSRNVVRASWRERAHEREETDVASTPSDAARVEAVDLVHRALETLPMVRREVVVLHQLDDVPMKDVAEALEMPLNSAYSHYRRGMEQLRGALVKLGGAP